MLKLKWIDEYCHKCGKQLNSWDARCSKALVYKYATCEKCIAEEYGMDVDALRRKMEHYFGIVPCMRL